MLERGSSCKQGPVILCVCSKHPACLLRPEGGSQGAALGSPHLLFPPCR